MNATDHPLVHTYLTAVERESAALPTERRAELIADLREHITVSLGAGDGDARIRDVLERLGEPRTLAASALAEEPDGRQSAAPAERRGRTRLTLALLAVGGLLCLANPFVGAVALIAGLVLLAKSPLWTSRQKAVAAAASVIGPVLVGLAGLLLASSGVSPAELLVAVALCLGLPLAGTLSLWRATRG
ncbi:HAAS signaling domain-containing protein [Streptomyces sp. NPDC002073]